MGVALVTPFMPDGTAVDYDSLANIIDYQIGAGADFIVALGTTAETPTLTPEERSTVSRFVVKQVAGRIPLVLGLGGNSTAAVTYEASHADLSGYSAILSVVPYYNKPSQSGIEAHFRAVADASPLPVILYNVPGRTGINMAPATVGSLATHPNIIGIKEASGSVNQTAEIIRCTPPDFTLLSGDDGITLSLMALGAQGVISVVGNAYPGAFTAMVQAQLRGDNATAAAIHHRMGPIYRPLFSDGNPSGIKAILAMMGLCAETVRLPLCPVGEETRAKLRSFVEANPREK